jgi:hypothetical protein
MEDRPILPLEALKIDHLSEELQAHVLSWSEGMIASNYHGQIVAIATILGSAEPPVKWRAIGLIFGLNPGTISKHVSGRDWTGLRTGRPATLPTPF